MRRVLIERQQLKVELSKWIGTCKSTWLTTGSGWVEIFL